VAIVLVLIDIGIVLSSLIYVMATSCRQVANLVKGLAPLYFATKSLLNLVLLELENPRSVVLLTAFCLHHLGILYSSTGTLSCPSRVDASYEADLQ
tara:strand:- start:374 stop:661 length:288 start_codon:yes stop_codon:yes gene_type:complete